MCGWTLEPQVNVSSFIEFILKLHPNLYDNEDGELIALVTCVGILVDVTTILSLLTLVKLLNKLSLCTAVELWLVVDTGPPHTPPRAVVTVVEFLLTFEKMGFPHNWYVWCFRRHSSGTWVLNSYFWGVWSYWCLHYTVRFFLHVIKFW